MKLRRHYGFAALSPGSGYPDFRSGLTLSCIPCDFLLSEPVGYQLKLFLENEMEPWQRVKTQSTMTASRELVSKVIAPELKAVSTFRSTDRTRLHLDGIVQVVEFTCHAASDAVVQQLLAGSDLQHSVLKEWVAEHAGLLSLAGGLVFCALREFETEHLDEHESKAKEGTLRRYMELAAL
jgi:hypothetical protein